MAIQIIELGTNRYILLKQIQTGVSSVVWKALLPQVSLSQETNVWPEKGAALRQRLLLDSSREVFEFPGQEEGIFKEVAIKIPRSGEFIPSVRSEAKRIDGLRQDRLLRDRVPGVIDNRMEDAEAPLLVSEWITGIQVDSLAEPFSEPEAVRLMQQLSKILLDLRAIPITATDTVKPNSLILSSDKQELFLIDWNLVGEMGDFARITLPYAGQTAYRLAVGKGLELDESGNVRRETIGWKSDAERWGQLSSVTRELIRAMLLADLNVLRKLSGGRQISAEKPTEIAQALHIAWTDQRNRWQRTTRELLAEAITADKVFKVNLYDLVRLKTDPAFAETHFGEAIKAARDWLSAQTRVSDILSMLDWMRYRFANDAEVRSLWLAAAASNLSSQTDKLAVFRKFEEAIGLINKSGTGEAEEALLQAERLIRETETEGREISLLRIHLSILAMNRNFGQNVMIEESAAMDKEAERFEAGWMAFHVFLNEQAPELKDLSALKQDIRHRAQESQARMQMYRQTKIALLDAIKSIDLEYALRCSRDLADSSVKLSRPLAEQRQYEELIPDLISQWRSELSGPSKFGLVSILRRISALTPQISRMQAFSQALKTAGN